MPDTPPTEEEKDQIGAILKRWRNYDARWCIVTAILVIVLMDCDNRLPLPPLLYNFLAMPLTCLSCYFLWRWSLQRFTRRLSNEERELLVRVAEDQSYAHSKYNSLLKVYRIDAKKEYLRASAQTQDDTLLRAAHSTDEKAQDQLLRPAPTDE